MQQLSHAWPAVGRSALHADRSVAALQASGRESPASVAICSTQHLQGRPRGLLHVPSCPKPCRVVTERCRAWCAGAAWSMRLTWSKRACLRWLMVLIMGGSSDSLATSSFLTKSYQWIPSIRLWFIIRKPWSFTALSFNNVHVSEAYRSTDRTFAAHAE